MIKYLIFGNGWLGNILKNYLEGVIYPVRLTIEQREFLPEAKESTIWINTIAKTDIDWCEKNKEEAFYINTLLALNLAKQARADGKKYIFFSSACVFESKNRRDIKFEEDTPNPQCWYAWTKVVAEQLILEANPDALIIRLRLPVSEVSHPRNTLDKLLKYDKINTNQESLTVVEDMLPILKILIDTNAKGIYHLINGNTISSAEIADLLEHPHKKVTKKLQDERLAKEGRAKRVTTYVKSEKIPLLPDIKKRMPEIIKKWKQTKI